MACSLVQPHFLNSGFIGSTLRCSDSVIRTRLRAKPSVSVPRNHRSYSGSQRSALPRPHHRLITSRNVKVRPTSSTDTAIVINDNFRPHSLTSFVLHIPPSTPTIVNRTDEGRDLRILPAKDLPVSYQAEACTACHGLLPFPRSYRRSYRHYRQYKA